MVHDFNGFTKRKISEIPEYLFHIMSKPFFRSFGNGRSPGVRLEDARERNKSVQCFFSGSDILLFLLHLADCMLNLDHQCKLF